VREERRRTVDDAARTQAARQWETVMPHICINALSVNPAMTGIGQYAKSMLDALACATGTTGVRRTR
jgi:hypothetical protein